MLGSFFKTNETHSQSSPSHLDCKVPSINELAYIRISLEFR